MDQVNLFDIASSLFVILNSLGNIPIFVALLGRYEIKRQRIIIFRELIFALVLLLLFNYFGEYILNALHISQQMISIAGGTLLFIIALSMIFPKEKAVKGAQAEPMVVPLAIPIITGPGAITTTMIYAQQVHNHFLMTIAILLAWVPTLAVLLASSYIKKILGEKGLIACERLGGMLLSLIAVRMISTGIIELVKSNF